MAAELVEQAYRALRFEQRSEQEILDALTALVNEGHNSAMEGAQALLRKWAIEYARSGDDNSFRCLEVAAEALDSLKVPGGAERKERDMNDRKGEDRREDRRDRREDEREDQRKPVDPGFGNPGSERPDQGLPGGQGGKPDNTLPGSPGHPDQDLPGEGINPDLDPNLDPNVKPGQRPKPDQGLPTDPAKPDQGLPPTATPKE